MDDDSLDKMDPYQRGSSDIIWDSMLKGSFVAQASASRKPEHDYYADALEPSAGDDGNQLGSASNTVEDVSGPAESYVAGPMVVRVLPDGRPVPGDVKTVPKDEDVEEFLAMRSKPIPSIEDIIKQKNNNNLPVNSAPEKSH